MKCEYDLEAVHTTHQYISCPTWWRWRSTEFSHNWDQQSHNQTISSSSHGIDQITLHILSRVTQCDIAWHPSHSWHTRHHLITPVQHCSHSVSGHFYTPTLWHSKSQNLVKTTGKIWILSWDTWQTLTRQNVTQITTTSTWGLSENTLLLDM